MAGMMWDIPDYYNMMEFTSGKWMHMTEQEQDTAVKNFTAAVAQRKLEMRQEMLRTEWNRLCPPLYRETDPDRLPNLAKFNEVQEWQFGPEGLILIGASRRGKTRAVYALLRRLHFEEKRKVLVFGPKDLQLARANDWRDREEDAADLTTKLRQAEILFFDDLDTIKFTEAVEGTLYDTLEHRMAFGKPMLITLNQCGTQLAILKTAPAVPNRSAARFRMQSQAR